MNCLKLFEVSEEISEWNCPRCKVPCPAKKQLCPFSYPPVLIIHLKRFQINMLNGQWMKCSKKIQVSDQLTFEPSLVEDDRHKIVYKLYAAIIHQASHWIQYMTRFLGLCYMCILFVSHLLL